MSTSDAPRPPFPRWNPDGELDLALRAAADELERTGLDLSGGCRLSDMTRRQRAALGAFLGCGMVRPQVMLHLETLDAIFRGKYGLAGGLVEACETALGRPLTGTTAEVAMSPDLTTEARLEPILAELVAREPIFHRLELGTTREDFDAQTAPDFWEIGASGRAYSREFVWATLATRYAAGADDPWQTDRFHCRELAPATYLLTYVLRQGERTTRRATIWQRTTSGWRILFHQGTEMHDES